MIRTGYIRWEIEATESRSTQDRWANEIVIRARPSYRRARIKWTPRTNVQQRFAHGEATYAEVLAATPQEPQWTEITLPDLGPWVHRYSLSDRDTMPHFWMTKINSFVAAVATEIVHCAGEFRQLVLESGVVRAGYARLVGHEILRVIEGRSHPGPTNETEPFVIDVSVQQPSGGIPELVAAELVRDVFSPEDFEEFASRNRVTVAAGDFIYRIYRRTHALIDVWGRDRTPKARLCLVFQDPGLPPSDELVMKYLLVKHNPKMLWEVANRFPAPTKWEP